MMTEQHSRDEQWAEIVRQDRAQLAAALEAPVIHSGHTTKRVRRELQHYIREPDIPFISLSPIDKHLEDVLGIIRGPPDSPL